MTDAPDETLVPFANPKQKQQQSHSSSSPGAAKQPPPGQGKNSDGLAAGYWRENGFIWTTKGPKRRPVAIRLCSDMRAVHAESSPDGRSWALKRMWSTLAAFTSWSAFRAPTPKRSLPSV